MYLRRIKDLVVKSRHSGGEYLLVRKTLDLLGYVTLFVRKRKDSFSKKFRFRVVMGDQKGSGSGLFQDSSEVWHQRIVGRLVEPGERFIEQKDPRAGGKCASKSDAAGFSSRQISDVSVGKVGQIDHLKKFVYACKSVRFGHSGDA